MACSVPFHAAWSTRAAAKGKSDSKFQVVPFTGCQVDDHRVFIEASKFRRIIVRIAEDWMKEGFTCARWQPHRSETGGLADCSQ